MTDDELSLLTRQWLFWARENQRIPEGDWRLWLILAGRGWGKTRTGAEFIRSEARTPETRIALIGATAADVRDVMVEGQSGIMSVYDRDNRPDYEPSKRRLTWPNGSVATTFSAEEPDRLRGFEFNVGWGDEIAAYKYPDAWDQFMFGLRQGDNPRALATTTPRPVRLIRELVKQPHTVVTKGSSHENRDNLAEAFFEQIIKRYEGTRLGRQEIYAELLDDIPGALWQRINIDANRVTEAPQLNRIVIAIDPATTSRAESDETGIVASGSAYGKKHQEYYVLADKSMRGTPNEWATQAIALFHDLKADRIVAETNQGGEMVESTLRTVWPDVPYTSIHASRGKSVRAEPVAALYEQHRVHHVGSFPELEDQQCMYTTDGQFVKSPDRGDALVYSITELSTTESVSGISVSSSLESRSRWDV